MLKNILFNIIFFDFNILLQYNLKIKKNKIKNKRIKNNKFRKLLNFFNIHVNLYLIKNIIKYITIINSNILIKKLKHKIFKIIIYTITFLNFIKYLFAKNILK